MDSAVINDNISICGFPGTENTEELTAVTNELFYEQKLKYRIDHVSGKVSKFEARLSSQISNEEDVLDFIKTYMKQDNETLRIHTKKKLTERSSYLSVSYFRCHHNTRNFKTRDVEAVLKSAPHKRLKNTNCTFSLCLKVRRVPPADGYSCTINLQWSHNHPTAALQVLTFKDM